MYLVPKFHLPAHVLPCRTRFSFNYAPGVVGQMEKHRNGDGQKSILWLRYREMGPGTHRDTLDYHFGDSNWQKVVGLGRSFYSHEI